MLVAETELVLLHLHERKRVLREVSDLSGLNAWLLHAVVVLDTLKLVKTSVKLRLPTVEEHLITHDWTVVHLIHAWLHKTVLVLTLTLRLLEVCYKMLE
jgi:hypothetical protein